MLTQHLGYAAQYEIHFALWTSTFHGNATQQTELAIWVQLKQALMQKTPNI